MPRPLTYLDECVHVGLAIRLRARGFDVEIARDAGVVGVTDAGQPSYATRREAVIVTHDSRHFRLLHLRLRPHGGIILLPDSPLDRQEIRAAMLLDWAATLPEYRSHLFAWHDLPHLLIGGTRLPGYREDEVRLALGQE